MKNRKNNFIKLGIFLFGIFIILWSCQKDENFIELAQLEVTKSPFKIKTVNLTEIPKVRDFLIEKTYDNLFNKSSDVNRAIFDNENILEVIDTLEYTNYTFRFKFPNTLVGEFYNLVVGKTEKGENITPYVIKYKCDETQLDEFIDNNFDFNSFKGIVSRHKYTDFFELGGIFLRTETDTNCPSQNDENGDPIACDNSPVDGSNTGSTSGGNGGSDSDGGSESGGPGSSSGSGGGTGGSCVFAGFELVAIDCPAGCNCSRCAIAVGIFNCPVINTINTTTSCPDCPSGNGGVGVLTEVNTIIEDHCPDLKNLIDVNKSNAKPFLENLKTTVDQAGENGFSMKKDGNDYTNTNLPATAEAEIGIPIRGQNYAGAHSHPSVGVYPMFSWGDIHTLLKLYRFSQNSVKNEVTFMLASKNNFLNNQVNIFALKINNFGAFRTAFYKALADIVKERPDLEGDDVSDEDKLDALNEKLGRKYGKAGENQQEKAFLENFKKFEISLYKANENLDNWAEVTTSLFSPNISGIIETPCN